MALSCRNQITDIETNRKNVNAVIDQWHLAAAEANFDKYFSYYEDNAVFIGTDPTENWKLNEFKALYKPYFDKGKTWNFVTIERNVYFSDDGKMAWFDELLDTQMKICRGSGVLKQVGKDWKISHYVLSIAIPNHHTKEVVEIKSVFDDDLMDSLKTKKSFQK